MHDPEAKAQAKLEAGEAKDGTPGSAGQDKRGAKSTKAARNAM